MPTNPDINQILQKYWGYKQFRALQEDIIMSVLEGRDTLGLMPTGGGKSLTFQIPTLAMDGLAIVVTPIVSLMTIKRESPFFVIYLANRFNIEKEEQLLNFIIIMLVI